MRAEGEKQSLILAAEGRQQAANRDAEARERLALAEAEATRVVAAAAANGGEAALRYFIADRYVTAFGRVVDSPGSRLVLVPMEATAIAGGITQAMELLRAPPPAMPSAPPPHSPFPPPLPGTFAGSVPNAGA